MGDEHEDVDADDVDHLVSSSSARPGKMSRGLALEGEDMSRFVRVRERRFK